MKANPKNQLFKIEIIVSENCQALNIITITKSPSYQEIIGAIDVQKMALFIEQSEYNIKAWIKEKEKLKKIQKAKK